MEGARAYLDPEVAPPPGEEPQLIWGSIEEANAAQGALYTKKRVTDPSFPRTREDGLVWVQTIVWVMRNMTDIVDKEKMQKQWTNIMETRDARIQYVAWSLFSQTKRYHTLEGQLDPTNPDTAKSPKIQSFAEHMNKLLRALKSTKTVCRHVTSYLFINTLVDGPDAAMNRVTSNRRVNNSKKEKSVLGAAAAVKLAESGVQMKAEDAEKLIEVIKKKAVSEAHRRPGRPKKNALKKAIAPETYFTNAAVKKAAHMKVDELRNILKERGLPRNGRKEALIRRLLENDEGKAAEGTPITKPATKPKLVRRRTSESPSKQTSTDLSSVTGDSLDEGPDEDHGEDLDEDLDEDSIDSLFADQIDETSKFNPKLGPRRASDTIGNGLWDMVVNLDSVSDDDDAEGEIDPDYQPSTPGIRNPDVSEKRRKAQIKRMVELGSQIGEPLPLAGIFNVPYGWELPSNLGNDNTTERALPVTLDPVTGMHDMLSAHGSYLGSNYLTELPSQTDPFSKGDNSTPYHGGGLNGMPMSYSSTTTYKNDPRSTSDHGLTEMGETPGSPHATMFDSLVKTSDHNSNGFGYIGTDIETPSGGSRENTSFSQPNTAGTGHIPIDPFLLGLNDNTSYSQPTTAATDHIPIGILFGDQAGQLAVPSSDSSPGSYPDYGDGSTRYWTGLQPPENYKFN